VDSELKGTVSTPESKLALSCMSDSSSISSISSDGSNSANHSGSFKKAKIQSRLISNYIPPHLPKINKKASPLFSYWIGSPKVPKIPKIPKAQILNEGDKCSTPFGPATVVEHRVAEKIVVVDMVGWKARAYLNEVSFPKASKLIGFTGKTTRFSLCSRNGYPYTVWCGRGNPPAPDAQEGYTKRRH
jgi:hypothetical protein